MARRLKSAVLCGWPPPACRRSAARTRVLLPLDVRPPRFRCRTGRGSERHRRCIRQGWEPVWVLAELGARASPCAVTSMVHTVWSAWPECLLQQPVLRRWAGWPRWNITDDRVRGRATPASASGPALALLPAGPWLAPALAERVDQGGSFVGMQGVIPTQSYLAHVTPAIVGRASGGANHATDEREPALVVSCPRGGREARVRLSTPHGPSQATSLRSMTSRHRLTAAGSRPAPGQGGQARGSGVSWFVGALFGVGAVPEDYDSIRTVSDRSKSRPFVAVTLPGHRGPGMADRPGVYRALR